MVRASTKAGARAKKLGARQSEVLEILLPATFKTVELEK